MVTCRWTRWERFLVALGRFREQKWLWIIVVTVKVMLEVKHQLLGSLFIIILLLLRCLLAFRIILWWKLRSILSCDYPFALRRLLLFDDSAHLSLLSLTFFLLHSSLWRGPHYILLLGLIDDLNGWTGGGAVNHRFLSARFHIQLSQPCLLRSHLLLVLMMFFDFHNLQATGRSLIVSRLFEVVILKFIVIINGNSCLPFVFHFQIYM